MMITKELYTIRVFNFEGFKFSWILWLLAIHENIDSEYPQIFLLMAPATKFCLYQFCNTCWKWRTMSKEQAAEIFLGM